MSRRGATSLGVLGLLTATLHMKVVHAQENGAPPVEAATPTGDENDEAFASTGQSEERRVEPEPPSADSEGAAAVAYDVNPVSAAERALSEVDFAGAMSLAAQALEEGNLELNETLRAYRVYAVAAAQLGETGEATEAFKRLFALEPQSNIERRLSPTRRNPALDARGFWNLHSGEFQSEVLFDRQLGQIVVRTRDALGWFKQVDVVSRVDGGSYRRRRQAVSGEMEFEEVISPTSTVEVYIELFDAKGNMLQRVGDERMPLRFVPSSAEVADSTRDIRGGQAGSYGRRLEELGAEVNVHGFVTAELSPNDDAVSFDLHHATVWFQAVLMKRASLEFGLEVEHLFSDIEDIYVPHAFIDLSFFEPLNARVGFFEAPVGAFNEYLYPDFLRITALPPLFTREIVPALWSEVGIQLRGRWALNTAQFLTYAVFISNGLEQHDETPGDGEVEEGGPIREMRFNTRDQYSSSKAVGGRVGYEAGPFDVGVSGYRGRYTVDAARSLNLLDVDASLRTQKFTARTEFAMAFQEVTDSTIKKYGGYVLVAYRVIPHIDLYAQYDVLTMEGSQHRVLLGGGVYPFPEAKGTRSLRLKAEVGPNWLPGSDKASFTWFTQLTTGF